MALRLIGCSLLLISLAAFKVQTARPTQTEAKNEIPRWEYRVTRLDASQCATNLNPALDGAGQDGWDLVSYGRLETHPPVVFPTEAQGTLLIRPGANGPGRDTSPPTADSFDGNIQMKM